MVNGIDNLTTIVSYHDSDLFGGVEYNKIINTDIDIQVGDVCSAYIKFKVKTNSFSIGDELSYYVIPSSTPVGIGIFYVTNIEKGKTDYTITAYDAISKFDADCSAWKNSIVVPITLGNIFKSMCNELGVPYVNSHGTPLFTNMNHIINENYLDDGLSYRQVLSYIAQASGGYAECTTTGAVNITPLGKTTYATAFTNANYKRLEQADYICPNITKVWLGMEDGDAGITAGTGTNVLKIYNNPLLYITDYDSAGTPDPTRVQAAVTNIYNAVKNFTYRPFKMSVFNTENSGSIAGQKISIDSENTYVFSVHWDKSGMTLEATGNPEREEVQFLSFAEQRMKGSYNTLKRTVDETVSEIGDVSGNVSTLTQTVNGLSTTVSGKADKATIISTINQSAEQITIEASKLNLNGYVTMTNLSTSGQTSINGDNIKTGTITLGGQNNGNGQMVILDNANTEFGRWNNSRLRVYDDSTNSHNGNERFAILRAGDADNTSYGIKMGVLGANSNNRTPYMHLSGKLNGLDNTGYIYPYEITLTRGNSNANPDTTVIGAKNETYAATLSRQSGELTVNTITCNKWGRVIQLTVLFDNTSFSAGTVFSGFTNILPESDVMGCSFIGTSALIGWIKTSGQVEIRACGGFGYAGTITMSWTYLLRNNE